MADFNGNYDFLLLISWVLWNWLFSADEYLYFIISPETRV